MRLSEERRLVRGDAVDEFAAFVTRRVLVEKELVISGKTVQVEISQAALEARAQHGALGVPKRDSGF